MWEHERAHVIMSVPAGNRVHMAQTEFECVYVVKKIDHVGTRTRACHHVIINTIGYHYSI